MAGAFQNLGATVAKSIGSALFLFLLTRILGKKQISQLSFFDYIIGISIGSVPVEIVAHHGLSLVGGLSCMLVWALIPLIFSFLSLHSIAARTLLDGTSSVLIQDGKILEKNLRRSRFTIDDLLEELRLKDVFRIRDVRYAILETNGKLSVLKNTWPDSPPAGDYCLPVIIDGVPVGRNMEQLHVDEPWLIRELQKANVPAIAEVLLAECDKSRKLFIIPKSR